MSEYSQSTDNPKRIKSNSIIIGLAVNSAFIVDSIQRIVRIENLFAYFFVALLIASVVINRSIKVGKKNIVIILVLFAQLIFGYFFVATSSSSYFLLCFLTIGLSCSLISIHRLDYKVVFDTIVISSLAFSYEFFLFLGTRFSVYDAGSLMGIAYSILPVMFASAIVALDGTNRKVKRILSAFLLALTIIELFALPTRGAYLCALIFFAVFVFLKTRTMSSTKLKILYVFIIIIAAILFVILKERIESSTWYYRVFGIKSEYFLNGRELDLGLMFDFRSLEYFIFGSGVGSVKLLTHETYIHNVFGQVYFEQGIICSICLLVMILKKLWVIIKKNELSINHKYFILLLFCASIVRLNISYFYWIDGLFWIFVFMPVNSKKTDIA